MEQWTGLDWTGMVEWNGMEWNAASTRRMRTRYAPSFFSCRASWGKLESGRFICRHRTSIQVFSVIGCRERLTARYFYAIHRLFKAL